jgi:hypothetical protein
VDQMNGLFVSTDGTQFWYKDGNIHREDGPAVIYPDGDKRWWFVSNEYQAIMFDSKLVLVSLGNIRPTSFDLTDPASIPKIKAALKRRKMKPGGWLSDLLR